MTIPILKTFNFFLKSICRSVFIIVMLSCVSLVVVHGQDTKKREKDKKKEEEHEVDLKYFDAIGVDVLSYIRLWRGPVVLFNRNLSKSISAEFGVGYVDNNLLYTEFIPNLNVTDGITSKDNYKLKGFRLSLALEQALTGDIYSSQLYMGVRGYFIQSYGLVEYRSDFGSYIKYTNERYNSHMYGVAGLLGIRRNKENYILKIGGYIGYGVINSKLQGYGQKNSYQFPNAGLDISVLYYLRNIFGQ